MKDNRVLIGFIKENGVIIGYNVINTLTFEVESLIGTDYKYFENGIPKKLFGNYAEIDKRSGRIIRDSLTLISRAYGYQVLSNGNGSRIYVTKTKELIRNARNMLKDGERLTNIEIVDKIDGKGKTLSLLSGSILDVSTSLTTSLPKDIEEIQSYFMNIIIKRVMILDDKSYIKIGVNENAAFILGRNIIAIKEILSLSGKMRNEILWLIYKKQTLDNYILETLDMGKCIEDYKNSFV